MRFASLICLLALLLTLVALPAEAQSRLDPADPGLQKTFEKEIHELRKELFDAIPRKKSEYEEFLSSDKLDGKLCKLVILLEATPKGLAEFARQGKQQAKLIEQLLSQPDLMKQMLIADGARAAKKGRQLGPSQYGRAMQIYSAIRKASSHSSKGILNRLALAVSLEHSVPIKQTNPAANKNALPHVDPVKRYLHYEKAFLEGELDPAFKRLTTWELRMVVDGDEPDETLAWGRKMLRNFRPDHIFNSNFGWRYVSIVGSDVKYGSENVKRDRPELQKYQNILMNGGVCGRRAFFGRFILRAFGVPTIARPSRGHGALAHWTPQGWVVNLGGGWGCGWTKTIYKKDVDFLATTQARRIPEEFVKVKRARWAGTALAEKRTYAEKENHELWHGIAIRIQREIIAKSKSVTLKALGEDLAEANESTKATKVKASPVKPADRQVHYGPNGSITVPAAAYRKPRGNTRDVVAMKSFGGGLQVFLPRFFPQGKTIMRGGTWKGNANACTSGIRMLSGGYGRYENWGLRVAMSAGKSAQKNLKVELGENVSLDLVYIPPGSFVMGGESKTDGRFQCVEVPTHQVKITKGFYLGKFEVTQAQYQVIMGKNPSRSTKAPNCPVDNVSEADAKSFCGKLAEKTGQDFRLPTEAEWEYASRAGKDSKWFFGNDPAKLGDYAWFKGNAKGKSHPVGQKQPNPWGLHDIYGNVCERISDKYARGYYANSPKEDPTGPSQGTKSQMEYRITVKQAGEYSLTAKVVTSNYHQRLICNVNDSKTKMELQLPFTEGNWKTTQPIKLKLVQGENILRFYRNKPPQYGIAIKEFSLQRLK